MVTIALLNISERVLLSGQIQVNPDKFRIARPHCTWNIAHNIVLIELVVPSLKEFYAQLR